MAQGRASAVDAEPPLRKAGRTTVGDRLLLALRPPGLSSGPLRWLGLAMLLLAVVFTAFATSQVTSNTPSAGSVIGNGNNNSASANVPYSSRTFFLYNNAVLLDQSTATSSCPCPR